MSDATRSDGLPITVAVHWPRPHVCLVQLADAQRRGHPRRLHLLGVHGNRRVTRVLDLTGLLPLLDIHDSLDELLHHLGQN